MTWGPLGPAPVEDHAQQAVDRRWVGSRPVTCPRTGTGGEDWVPAHQAEPEQDHAATQDRPATELGLVSEDGQWVWDGEQWRSNPQEELTPELFQEVIAQSIQVNSSGTA